MACLSSNAYVEQFTDCYGNLAQRCSLCHPVGTTYHESGIKDMQTHIKRQIHIEKVLVEQARSFHKQQLPCLESIMEEFQKMKKQMEFLTTRVSELESIIYVQVQNNNEEEIEEEVEECEEEEIPPTIQSQFRPPQSAQNSNLIMGRCNGITKKNEHCRNRVKATECFCHLHK